MKAEREFVKTLSTRQRSLLEFLLLEVPGALLAELQSAPRASAYLGQEKRATDQAEQKLGQAIDTVIQGGAL